MSVSAAGAAQSLCTYGRKSRLKRDAARDWLDLVLALLKRPEHLSATLLGLQNASRRITSGMKQARQLARQRWFRQTWRDEAGRGGLVYHRYYYG